MGVPVAIADRTGEHLPPAGQFRPEAVFFLPSLFCQCPLPRARVAGLRFSRITGQAWLHIQSGYLDTGNGPDLQPVPYGMFARLWLVWMTNRMVRGDHEMVPLGPSVSFFLKQFDLPHDGRRSRMLYQQLHAIAGCRFQLGFQTPTFTGYPLEQWLTWSERQRHGIDTPPFLCLSPGFAAELRAHAVPLDASACLRLRDATLAFDTYAWLAHRLHRLPTEGLFLTWSQLHFQFGQEYQGTDGVRLFQRAFVTALKRVAQVYPQARIRPTRHGLDMSPSAPPVPLTHQSAGRTRTGTGR